MTSCFKLLMLSWTIACLISLPVHASAWTPPGHMLHAAIAYQILQQETATIATVKALLQHHPWYESRWRNELEAVPKADRDELLFMLAARWADDVRTQDREQNRGPWHYIYLPRKPAGQPEHIRMLPPQEPNILTALAENQRIALADTDTSRRAIAVTWLFHLVGDIHQPLHTAQIFTTAYPKGDEGGNQICLRQSARQNAADLHGFWDGSLAAPSAMTELSREATALRKRPAFARDQLAELGSGGFEAWANESFYIATTIAHQNGMTVGTPRGSAKTCGDVKNVKVLPTGYARIAAAIAHRRIMLAGFRLADLLASLHR